ncbi:hypothetical protein N7481_009834 [Penicillium waksmanii]|uniref:uncharacterized protein n=1 Tax=Penicillium waksmanii TaxID=69791 RepID=UPI0025484396|nr:uncharacterized protein N7481_009834 [Penicillium waksmanii]KAJ5976127.1 hypothetical protein N7481_009834 [Penicillium waksmanii]
MKLQSKDFIRLIFLAIKFHLTLALPSSPQPYSWTGSSGDDELSEISPLRGHPSLLGVIANEVNSESSASVPSDKYGLAPGQDASAELGIPFTFEDTANPQPIRGDLGSTDPGPRTYNYDRLNPDTLAPPGSDNGVHNLSLATAMAGVDMKLAAWVYGELHWHKANEWGLILNGSVRLQTMNEDGQTFVDDLTEGDVGDFDDGGTSLASEMFHRNSKDVLSKNLQAPLSDFDDPPKDQLYIFNGTPAPKDLKEQNVTGPGGLQLAQKATPTIYRSKKHTRPHAALVTIKPGAMREIHWHGISDEWGFFISGNARVSVYIAPTSGATFDFSAGDVSYVPAKASHYIENIGNEDIVFLEAL